MKKYAVLLLFIAGFVQNSVCYNVHNQYDIALRRLNYSHNRSYGPVVGLIAKDKYTTRMVAKEGYNFYDFINQVRDNKTLKKANDFTDVIYCVYRNDHKMKKKGNLKRSHGIIGQHHYEVGKTELRTHKHKKDGFVLYSDHKDLGWWALSRCHFKANYNKMSTTFLPFFTRREIQLGLRKTIPQTFHCEKAQDKNCWDKNKVEWRDSNFGESSPQGIPFYVITSNSSRSLKKDWRRHEFKANSFKDFYVILNKNFSKNLKDVQSNNDPAVRILEVPWMCYCEFAMRDKDTGERMSQKECEDIFKTQKARAEAIVNKFDSQQNVNTVWDWDYSRYYDGYKALGESYTFRDIFPSLNFENGFCIRRGNYYLSNDNIYSDLIFERSGGLMINGRPAIQGVYNTTPNSHDLGWWATLSCEKENRDNFDNMASVFLPLGLNTVKEFFVLDDSKKHFALNEHGRRVPLIPPSFFCKNGTERSCWDSVVGRWRSPLNNPELENQIVIKVYVINNDGTFVVHTFNFSHYKDVYVVLNEEFKDKNVVLGVPWLARCISTKKYEDQARNHNQNLVHYCNSVMTSQEAAAKNNLKKQ